MPREKRIPATRRRKKKVFFRSKGFWGGRKNLLRSAKETVTRAMAFATRDRKKKKRAFRNLWVIRINAACRQNGISYSKFVSGLKHANVSLNRKSLAELAVHDGQAFKQLVELAKK